jgi:hypothetical protein
MLLVFYLFLPENAVILPFLSKKTVKTLVIGI